MQRRLIRLVFCRMSDPDSSFVTVRKSFLLAMGFSLLLHAAILFAGYSNSGKPGADVETTEALPQRRLVATLARAPVPASRPSGAEVSASASKSISVSAKPPVSSSKRMSPKPQIVPADPLLNRKWTAAERAEMRSFLEELDSEARPNRGQSLSSKALAMARQMGRSSVEDGVDSESKPASGKGEPVEPYSLEMYWEAFLRKLNRSAAFVENDRRARGQRKALVEISLNADGSLKDYRVLYAADQAAEIAYIKRVVERASPFSAFPPDIRKARDSMSIRMCVYPAREGEGGGFSRSWGSQGCRN